MAILNQKGSWLGLPDFGITEKLAGKVSGGKTTDLSQALSGNYGSSTPVYNGPISSPGVNKSTYAPSPSGGNPSSGNGSTGGQVLGNNTYNPQISSPDQNNGSGMSEMDLINNDYNNFQSMLNDQANLANQNFTNIQNAITSERDAAVTDAEAQRGIRNTELSNKAESGRANERLNLQKVRQLLQDLDQRNAARVSVMGGGGSVSEALADRYARTAQQNVGGVLQEGQRYQNDINIEKEKVAQFYDTSIQKIKDTAKAQIDDARMKLNENLSAIESDRRASAQAKMTARYDAWRSYYDNVNRAKLQAANFQAQYDLWAKTKAAELAGTSGYQIGEINPQDYSSYLSASNYSSGGVGAVAPTTTAYAPTTFKRYTKQEDQTDQYGNPIA